MIVHHHCLTHATRANNIVSKAAKSILSLPIHVRVEFNRSLSIIYVMIYRNAKTISGNKTVAVYIPF